MGNSAEHEIDYEDFLKFLDVGEEFFEQPEYQIDPELSAAAEARAQNRDGPKFGRVFARAMKLYEERPRTRDTQHRAATCFSKSIKCGEREFMEKRRLQKRLKRRSKGNNRVFTSTDCALGELTKLHEAYYNRGQCLAYMGDQKNAMKDFAKARKTSLRISEYQEVGLIGARSGDQAAEL